MLSSFSLFILLFRKAYAGWVDPDTATYHHFTKPLTETDDREFKLVFSDEFRQDGRTFGDGNDPRWTAIDKNDYTNDALHYYSSDNAETKNGVLNITTVHKTNSYAAFDEIKKVFYSDEKHIQSAMLQGWNKFCLTGGILEIRAKLPGQPQVGGLWPALWLLGNLARATYVGSSDYMWPWSYNTCDKLNMASQEISSCNKINHYGLHSYQGRGAPEIDLLEAMGGPAGKIPNTPIQRPYISSSLQVAPGVRNKRPVMGDQPVEGHWYTGMTYGNQTKTALNPFFYGVTLVHKPKSYTYQADALSANTQIDSSYFDDFHKYRLEWEPSDLEGKGGYIKWFFDDMFVYGIDSSVLNFTGSMIPNEPMYIILNTAVSSNWGFPKPCPADCDCTCFQCGKPDCECGLPDNFCSNIPASFEIDYVRVYQAVGDDNHKIGCSTESHPTAQFIKGHKERYKTENDKDVLLPIQKGGGPCRNIADCGFRGECSPQSSCVCYDKFTGPTCLANEGFNDQPDPQVENPIQLKLFSPPSSLMVVFAVFGLAFLVVLTREVSRKKNTTNQYNQLPTSTVSYNAAIQIKNDRRLLDSVLDKSSYQIQSKDGGQ